MKEGASSPLYDDISTTVESITITVIMTIIKKNVVLLLRVISKYEAFNMTNDEWAAEYWNKWIGKNADEATPQAGGCLLVNDDNKTEPMIMLMETAVNSPPAQNCKISSTQGILVPLWIGWCDTGSNKGATAGDLTDCAKHQNLGRIISDVKVDGLSVANFDVTQSVNPGSRELWITT